MDKPLTPRQIHTLEQLQPTLRLIAEVVTAYRDACVRAGMTKSEAFILAQRLEERLLGQTFEQAKEALHSDE